MCVCVRLSFASFMSQCSKFIYVCSHCLRVKYYTHDSSAQILKVTKAQVQNPPYLNSTNYRWLSIGFQGTQYSPACFRRVRMVSGLWHRGHH